MAWETVARGDFDDGSGFVIEHRVVYLPVPKSGSTLPLRSKSYRWRLMAADGSTALQGRPATREVVDAQVQAHRVVVQSARQ